MFKREIKFLQFNVHNCTGCNECELACSSKHESGSAPKKSRIRIKSLYPEPGIDFAIICQHCENPIPCAEVCPQGAIGRNDRTGAITISKTQCFGCTECIEACPYGAMYFNDDTGKAYKCDLCKGDPECVKYCDFDALTISETRSEIEYKDIYDKFITK